LRTFLRTRTSGACIPIVALPATYSANTTFNTVDSSGKFTGSIVRQQVATHAPALPRAAAASLGALVVALGGLVAARQACACPTGNG
jgi:hypothetical protein